MIILAIYLTGFLVMGTDRICDTIQNPPKRVVSTSEEVAMDMVTSALWPVALGFKIKQAIDSRPVEKDK